jgi:hypothetical protein
VLGAVSCWSSHGCIAVSQTKSNGPLAEVWSGESWTIQQTPDLHGGGGFSAVSCWSSHGCIAVGDRAHVKAALAEIWNGRSWSIQTTPITSPKSIAGVSSILLSVSCWSATGCIARGMAYNPVEQDLAEIWNGQSWSVQKTPNPLRDYASQSISCRSHDWCLAVGGAVVRHEGHTDTYPTLSEMWNGRSWQVKPTPDLPGLDSSLNAVSCWSSQGCVAVGYKSTSNSAVAETWNGEAWRINQTARLSPSQFRGVSCWSPSECVGVGGTQYRPLAEIWDGESAGPLRRQVVSTESSSASTARSFAPYQRGL